MLELYLCLSVVLLVFMNLYWTNTSLISYELLRLGALSVYENRYQNIKDYLPDDIHGPLKMEIKSLKHGFENRLSEKYVHQS